MKTKLGIMAIIGFAMFGGGCAARFGVYARPAVVVYDPPPPPPPAVVVEPAPAVVVVEPVPPPVIVTPRQRRCDYWHRCW